MAAPRFTRISVLFLTRGLGLGHGGLEIIGAGQLFAARLQDHVAFLEAEFGSLAVGIDAENGKALATCTIDLCRRCDLKSERSQVAAAAFVRRGPACFSSLV